MALFRRLVGFVLYVADWPPIPYHFELKRGDAVLGTDEGQKLMLRDTDTIDMSGDPERSIDRRLVFAVAVGMDPCRHVEGSTPRVLDDRDRYT